MNPRTTIALAGLLAALSLAYLFFFRGEDVDNPEFEGALFADVRPETVVRIEVMDWSRTRLERPTAVSRGEDGEYRLVAESVDRGRPVPARRATIEAQVAAFCDVRPLRVYDVSGGGDDRRFGLANDQRLEIAMSTSDGRRHLLEIGTEVPPHGVLARRSGRTAIYELDAQIVAELVAAPEALQDRRAFPWPAPRIDEIAIDSLEAPLGRLRLVRELLRWFLREPFDTAGDTARCDELRNAVAQLEIAGYEGAPTADGTTFLPEFRLTVGSRDLGRSMVLEMGPSEGGTRLARIVGSERWIRIGPSLEPFLRRNPGHFRERRPFFDIGASLSHLRVEQSGRVTLDAQRGARLLRVPIPGDEDGVHVFDEVDQSRLIAALRELRFEDYADDLPNFEPTSRAELTFGSGETASLLTLTAGPVDSLGLRPVRLSGERGSGLMRPAALSVLEEPYYAFIERTLGGCGAPWLLGALEIRDDRGRHARFGPRTTPAGTVHLVALTEAGDRPLPERVSEQVLGILARIPVERFVGGELLAATVSSPALVVRYQEAPGSTPTQLVPPSQLAPWIEIAFGKPGADGAVPATHGRDRGLLGTVNSKQVLPFYSLLESALR